MESGASWDAVVVGGGPAGSAVAARLAARGHRVLLLDRDRFPRPKPCGECLSPAAVEALDLLGALAAVRAEPHADIRGWRVVPQRGPAFEGSFPPERSGIAIPRSVLDRLLLEHARSRGAEVRLGARVTDVVRAGGRVAGVQVGSGAGREEIRARLVIGADGLRSVLVRRLGLLRRRPRLRKLALTAHVAGLAGLAERGELHLLPWGCLGLAAVGEGTANLTLVVGEAEAERVAAGRESYFDRVLREQPRLTGGRRTGEVLATGPFDWPTRSAVAEGALLVGDAAGYYDPFTGQGIYRALRGAELAAEVSDAALRADDLSARALAPYDRARRRAFASGVGVQHLVELFTARPPLLRLAADRLHRRPVLADALVAVTGDLWPARSLLRPSLLARLVV